MRTNLLKETIGILQEHNKTLADVEWFGTYDYEITSEQFITLADVQYDNGYGGAEVLSNLLVVGNGWWLERGEYDGSEWWDYKECPSRPSETKQVSSLLYDWVKGRA